MPDTSWQSECVDSYRSKLDGERRTAPRASVAALLDRPIHAGQLQGARLLGRAVDDEQRVVDLALWLDDGGRVTRARWKATTCVGLMACAERACHLLEAGCPPSALDAARLTREVIDLHRRHHGRATLVIQALQRALQSQPKQEYS